MHKPDTLSALFDDAGSAEELAALAGFAADDEARARWMRYQLIGDTLRSSAGSAYVDAGFATGIQARLADESPLAQPVPTVSNVVPLAVATPARAPGVWRPVVGFAAAASVSAFLLGMWTGGSRPDDQALAVQVPADARTSLAVASPAPDPAQTFATTVATASPEQVSSLPEAEYRRRMDSYLMNFSEQRARMGMPQAHAYVRVVGFDTPTEQH